MTDTGAPPPPPPPPTPGGGLSSQAIGGITAVIAVIVVIFLISNSDGDDPSPSNTTREAAPTTTTTTVAPTTTVGVPDPGTAYTEYEYVTDDTGTLEVEVPVVWNDRETEGWSVDGVSMPSIGASTDLEAWRDGWSTPGVFFAVSTSPQVTVTGTLDEFDASDNCDYEARFEYDDGLYLGEWDSWLNCGPHGPEADGSEFVNLATEPYAGGAVLLVQVVLVTDADEEALNNILNSFFYR